MGDDLHARAQKLARLRHRRSDTLDDWVSCGGITGVRYQLTPLPPFEIWNGADGSIRRSFLAPALGECAHCILAGRRVAVRRRAILVMPESERPHPRRSDRRCVHLQDAPDNGAVGEQAEVVFVSLAGGPAR